MSLEHENLGLGTRTCKYALGCEAVWDSLRGWEEAKPSATCPHCQLGVDLGIDVSALRYVCVLHWNTLAPICQNCAKLTASCSPVEELVLCTSFGLYTSALPLKQTCRTSLQGHQAFGRGSQLLRLLSQL